MKNLKDIILEKLKIDDISLVKEEFPIDGKLYDIIEFLKDDGFKKVPTYASLERTFENYEKYNVKCFGVDIGSTSIIEIINRSNSKFKNKLFNIKLAPYINYDDKYSIFDDITIIKDPQRRIVSKEEFLKELSEIL